MISQKNLTISRLTEGAEPLQVVVRKMTMSMINEGWALGMMYNLAALELAVKLAGEEVASSLESLNIMGSMPALAASMEHAFKQHASKQAVERMAKKAHEDHMAKVLKHFGAIDETRTTVGTDEAFNYRWNLSKGIIGNPCFIEICTGIRPEEWHDVDDEDFVRVCEEVYRQNLRFFTVQYPDLPKLKALPEKEQPA